MGFVVELLSTPRIAGQNPFNGQPASRAAVAAARGRCSVLETLRIGIIVRSFPLDRLNLQPWRYLTELARALRDVGHEVRFVIGARGIESWEGIPVARHDSLREFEEADGLRRLAVAHSLDGGICRLTASLFSSMRPEAQNPSGGARLVGVLLRSLHTGPDLLRRFLDPSLVPEMGLDLHHIAMFLSRQRRTWRLAPQYFRGAVFLWEGDRALGAAAGLTPRFCRTLPVPFDAFWLDRRAEGTSTLLERIPTSERRVVFAGPPEASRGVRDVLRLPAVLSRERATQILALLRDPRLAEPSIATRSVGPHTLVVVRGMVSREEMRAIYHTCHAAVFPYRWVRTGFPLVIPEAVAAGLPVVTTRVHPFRGLEGRSGLVFAGRGDVRGLASAVDRVLSERERGAIERANAEWIRRTPGWPDVARGYVEAMGT